MQLFDVFMMSFLGLISGGCLGWVCVRLLQGKKFYSLLISGGVLLCLLLIELLPEALNTYQANGVALGALTGIFGMALLNRFFHKNKRKNLFHSFVFLIVAIGVHNIPVGLTMGINTGVGDAGVQSSLYSVLFFHLLPEGIALFIPIFVYQYRWLMFLSAIFCLSLIIWIASWVGFHMPQVYTIRNSSWLMGVAIGTLGYGAIYEILIPAIKRISKVAALVILILTFMITFLYFRMM
ncbi:ZIP family metal transporter [Halobacillus sp. MO56]